MDDNDYCQLCLSRQSDVIFDQRDYMLPFKPNKSSYHSVINSDGYNFPVCVCIFCLNEKIYKCNTELKILVLKDLTFQDK